MIASHEAKSDNLRYANEPLVASSNEKMKSGGFWKKWTTDKRKITSEESTSSASICTRMALLIKFLLLLLSFLFIFTAVCTRYWLIGYPAHMVYAVAQLGDLSKLPPNRYKISSRAHAESSGLTSNAGLWEACFSWVKNGGHTHAVLKKLQALPFLGTCTSYGRLSSKMVRVFFGSMGYLQWARVLLIFALLFALVDCVVTLVLYFRLRSSKRKLKSLSAINLLSLLAFIFTVVALICSTHFFSQRRTNWKKLGLESQWSLGWYLILLSAVFLFVTTILGCFHTIFHKSVVLKKRYKMKTSSDTAAQYVKQMGAATPAAEFSHPAAAIAAHAVVRDQKMNESSSFETARAPLPTSHSAYHQHHGAAKIIQQATTNNSIHKNNSPRRQPGYAPLTPTTTAASTDRKFSTTTAAPSEYFMNFARPLQYSTSSDLASDAMETSYRGYPHNLLYDGGGDLPPPGSPIGVGSLVSTPTKGRRMGSREMMFTEIEETVNVSFPPGYSVNVEGPSNAQAVISSQNTSVNVRQPMEHSPSSRPQRPSDQFQSTAVFGPTTSTSPPSSIPLPSSPSGRHY